MPRFGGFQQGAFQDDFAFQQDRWRVVVFPSGGLRFTRLDAVLYTLAMVAKDASVGRVRMPDYSAPPRQRSTGLEYAFA
jgi:hypothetical protein